MRTYPKKERKTTPELLTSAEQVVNNPQLPQGGLVPNFWSPFSHLARDGAGSTVKGARYALESLQDSSTPAFTGFPRGLHSSLTLIARLPSSFNLLGQILQINFSSSCLFFSVNFQSV